METPDIIETTPFNITREMGGAIWLISTAKGLISLYSRYVHDYTPVTVFVRERGDVRAHVLWMCPNGGYVGSEY